MAGPRWHDAGIAQELPVQIFQGPSAEAALVERRHVALKFGVALAAIQRAAQILRDLRSGVEGSKCVSIGLPPVPKFEPVRTDHRTLLRRGSGFWKCRCHECSHLFCWLQFESDSQGEVVHSLLLFHRSRCRRPFAHDQKHGVFVLGAIPMHLLAEMRDETARGHWRRVGGIEFRTGAHPPGTL